MSQPHSNKSILAISEFLSYLRLKGFNITVDHYVRVQELLNRVAGNCPPEDLKTLLCPLLATTESQQEQFYRDFDSYAGRIASELPAPESEKKQPGRKNWIWIGLIIALTAVVLTPVGDWLIGMIAYIIDLLLRPKPPDIPDGKGPSVSPMWFYLAGIILLISSILARQLSRWIRRKRILQKQHEKRPPYNWPLKVEGTLIPIYYSDEINNAARAMRRRQVGEAQHLDIPSTVTATAEAAGFPDLRFKPDSKPTEYLVLIDRLSFRDHQSSLFAELVRTLSREGLFVVRYFCEDPRVCSNQVGDIRISLTDLQIKYGGHRLLIFSNGARMIDPMTGELASWTQEFLRWKERAVLTPHPPAMWGMREFKLDGLFIVSPATPKGISTLIDDFNVNAPRSLSYWIGRDSDMPLDSLDHSALTSSLRSYLGEPTFQWLCACAVYPEIHWDLTMYLGSLGCMREDLLTEENLRRLVRLPWLHNGSIPDEVRWVLINELDPVKEKCVRKALIELLEKNPPPEAYKRTYAADQYKLNLTAQRWFYQKDNESLRKLLGLIRSLPPSQALQDRTILRSVEASSSSGHPKGLSRLFFFEMWERFSFYSMLSLFVLYLRDPDQGFGWSNDQAILLYSTYLMFVYASPLIGGLLGDKVLGYRRAVMIGGGFFIAGYFLLSVRSLATLYAALTCLVIGNGLLKPNISVMVGNLYQEGSHLKDRAYGIFYMGINIGAMLGPFCMEFVLQRFGYSPGFALASLAMFISLGILRRSKKHIEDRKESNLKALSAGQMYKRAVLTVDAPPKEAIYQNPIDFVRASSRIAALCVIFLVVIVFWMVFHQSGSTLTYWANENTEWSVSGVISNSINPFWILMLTFPLVWFWKFLDRRGLEPSTPTKMALGMMLTSISFFILYFAAKLGEASAPANSSYDFKVSPGWLITSYGVVSLGELMLSPMGLSLVSKVAPVRLRGLMMGLWFIATAIGNKLTMIGIYWQEWRHSTFFGVLGGMALIMALILLLILKPLKKAMPGV